MNRVSEAILVEAVAAMERTFDSHAVIRFVMRAYPREYVIGLNEHVASLDPIMQGHAQLAKRLHSVTSIRGTRVVKTMNVRGEVTENHEWEKIAP